jgi:predicted RNase H-like HicB family nuclease
MTAGPQSTHDLFDDAYREACAVFARDVDISVTRDTDGTDDDRYVARVLDTPRTLAIAHGETPDDALENLIEKIMQIAKRAERDADERGVR